MVLDELAECASPADTLQTMEAAELEEAVNRFLHTLPERECNVFLRRYWYCDSVAEIAERTGYSQSKIKAILHRARKGLGAHLRKEGYDV